LATYSNFNKAFTSIVKKFDKAQIRSINRALTSTRAKFAKDASQELGVPSGVIKRRTRIGKAKSISSELSIATKYQMSAASFKPKSVRVMSARGPRLGASYEVKGKGRTLAPGGFIVSGKGSGKKIIIQRVGDSRYPTKSVSVDVFEPLALRAKAGLQRHMVDTFTKNFKADILYASSL
jgi:hypothetical protein